MQAGYSCMWLMKSCDTSMKLHRSYYKVGYMPATIILDNIFEKLLLLKQN